MKKIIIAITLLLPLGASASALPAFPMSFYGNVTINATSAPAGTIIRAYYGTTLAGQVSATEAGIYGYNDPTKKQLLVAEGTGTLRFTVSSSAINSGIETEGSSTLTYAAFIPGETVSKDLAFTYPIPAPTPTPTPAPSPSPAPVSSGGGGGGGGGGGSSTLYGCMDKKAANYSTVANQDNGACIYPVVSTTTQASNTSNQLPTPASHNISPGEVLGATAFVFTHNLKIGNSGDDVTELQKRLAADGFYAGPINSYFGPLTWAAVKKFQTSHGLEAVGSVGLKTRLALNQGSTSIITAPTLTSTTSGMVGYVFTLNLNVGSRNKEVTQLQTLLIKQGFLQPPVTGYFGLITKAAVQAYQAKYTIPSTGNVGPMTRTQLNKGN